MNHKHHDHHRMMMADFKQRFIVSVILTVPVLVLSPLVQDFLGYSIEFRAGKYVLFIFSAAIFLYGGKPFLKGLFREVKKRQPGMMTLIGVAISTAFVYSSAVVFGLKGKFFFWELVTLIDIMLLGHWIEMKATRGAFRALEGMAKLLPSIAHVIEKGEIKDILVSDVKKGDIVLIKPGEKIPADGKVIKGISNVQESMITGESAPVLKEIGDELFAGSVNEQGFLEIEVTNSGKNSYLSQMADLVSKAQESKSKTQDFANRAAAWLTLIGVSAGIITLFFWLYYDYDFVFSLERMVTVMVITCPHALGLAIPLVVSFSTSISAKKGLLIKDKKALEQARDIRAVVFDKTGTLTKGEFGVSKVVALDNYTDNDILSFVASLEVKSEHSIAKAIVRKAEKEKINILEVKEFLSLPGKGVQGIINNKLVKAVGSNYLKENNIKVEGDGKTIAYVLLEDKLIGSISLTDLIREESYKAVTSLKSMGIKTIMLTGDRKEVAKEVAERLGVEEFYAEVLPGEKAKIIDKIKSKGLKTAMVGDGVNDAPALASSDVGIAIGAGTDIAAESGDIILVKSNPQDVVSVFNLAKATYSKMKQNLWWAAGYNIIAIPLAAGILYNWGILLSPAAGAVLMSLSTVIVAFNAKLLRI